MGRLRICAEHTDVAPSFPEVRRALSLFPELTTLDATIIFTGDLQCTIDTHHPEGSDSGHRDVNSTPSGLHPSGSDLAFVNLELLHARGANATQISRVAAHELAHILAETTQQARDDLAGDVEDLDPDVLLAATIIEEYRIERALVERGFGANPHGMSYGVTKFPDHAVNEEHFVAITQIMGYDIAARQRAADICPSILAVQDRLAEHLGRLPAIDTAISLAAHEQATRSIAAILDEWWTALEPVSV